MGPALLALALSLSPGGSAPRVPDPVPLVDGLLAATAKVHGLTLVTRNVADIARTGVSLLDPFAG